MIDREPPPDPFTPNKQLPEPNSMVLIPAQGEALSAVASAEIDEDDRAFAYLRQLLGREALVELKIGSDGAWADMPTYLQTVSIEETINPIETPERSVKGKEACKMCSGTGRIQDVKGTYYTCGRCNGSKREP